MDRIVQSIIKAIAGNIPARKNCSVPKCKQANDLLDVWNSFCNDYKFGIFNNLQLLEIRKAN